jgi:hypothetical protein
MGAALYGPPTPGVFAKSAEMIEKEEDGVRSFARECKRVQKSDVKARRDVWRKGLAGVRI